MDIVSFQDIGDHSTIIPQAPKMHTTTFETLLNFIIARDNPQVLPLVFKNDFSLGEEAHMEFANDF